MVARAEVHMERPVQAARSESVLRVSANLAEAAHH
jgi:hypothetical protein